MDQPAPSPPADSAAPAKKRLGATVLPGVFLAGGVALAAWLAAPWVAQVVPVPAIVIALFIGIVLNPIADLPVFLPGLTLCVKTLLRIAVALLGLRVSLADIAALGTAIGLIVVGAMAATVVSGFLLARMFGLTSYLGALAGAATAVCGASATLATSTVLKEYPGKKADVAFVVIAVNLLSTVAMLLYPRICVWLGFDTHLTGALLGATIHDVAQVAGAGYAVSPEVGNTAVVVKLFRVLLLFPVVIAIGWWFARPNPPLVAIKTSVPTFALVFIALCILNSIVVHVPPVLPFYTAIKGTLSEAANWGLLVAISALGLGTSFSAMGLLGWRHIATVTATTCIILAIVTAGLIIVR